MISEKGISRKSEKPTLDFNQLRAEGVESIQALSGNEWTDYNLHDPGVTTLEVLCYALTDLAYRTELLRDAFTGEDLLAADFIDRYFFKPEEVNASLPITKWDFEDFTEKNHPQVLQAWFEEYPIFDSGNVVKGGYEIALLLKYDKRYGNLNTDVIHIPFEAGDAMLEVIFFDHNNKRMIWKDIKKIVECKLDQQGEDSFFVFENYNCQVALRLEVIYQNRTQTDFIYPKARVTASNTQKVKRKRFSIDAHKEAVIQKLESQDFLDALTKTLNREKYKANLLGEIKRTLLPCRNLCEDFISLRVVNEQDVKLDAEIILTDDAPDATAMVRKIFIQLDAYLLSQVKQSKQHPANKKNILYGSNLIEQMVKIEGVEAARILNLNVFIDGVPTISLKDSSSFECVHLQRFSYYVPKISRKKSNITFIRSNVTEKAQVPASEADIESYDSDENTSVKNVYPNTANINTFNISFFESLQEYHSIQKDFPEIYRLHENLSKDAPESLKARSLQFKTYLLFFERIMILYLQKLHRFNDLLSLKQKDEPVENELDRLKKYFPEISNLNLIDQTAWNEIDSSRDGKTELIRNHKILDHLLARFATSYAAAISDSHDVAGLTKTLKAKRLLLQDIPVITRDRSLGISINTTEEVWNSDLLSGFQKRVYRLLGLSHDKLQHVRLSKARGKEPYGFYLVEHILLLKKDSTNIVNKKFNSAADLLYDYIVNMSAEYKRYPAYSFQVTIVLPGWHGAWRSQKNRVENAIKDELPAHILPYFHWLNKKNMSEFESCYEDWLKAMLQLNR